MATTKLTLSVDKDTIDLAKQLASESNVSVSKLFKNFVKEKAGKRTKEDPILEKYKDVQIAPEILALTGILKGKYPEDMDYKDMKYEYLKDKYGL
jgi:hypothetical protein